MDSDTTFVLFLVLVIAAVILVSLVLIGSMVLIALPSVRRRRQRWQAAAASLGLQSDQMSMHGIRGLPVQVFWRIEGARMGRIDYSGRPRGGRAGLRFTYCRALLEPPLALGLTLAPANETTSVGNSVRAGLADFDTTIFCDAHDKLRAQIILSLVANDFVRTVQAGWKLYATDNYVDIKLGGDYFSQCPEDDPQLLAAALDTAVHCARRLLVAHGSLSARHCVEANGRLYEQRAAQSVS